MSNGSWIRPDVKGLTCKRVKFCSITICFFIRHASCLVYLSVCVCLSYGLVYIYSIIEVCVGHSSEWGEGISTLRSQQRERGMQAAGLCLSVQHREPTVLDYSYTHTVMKERFIWTNRVCVRSSGRQQEAHWLTSQLLGQKLHMRVCGQNSLSSKLHTKMLVAIIKYNHIKYSQSMHVL